MVIELEGHTLIVDRLFAFTNEGVAGLAIGQDPDRHVAEARNRDQPEQNTGNIRGIARYTHDTFSLAIAFRVVTPRIDVAGAKGIMNEDAPRRDLFRCVVAVVNRRDPSRLVFAEQEIAVDLTILGRFASTRMTRATKEPVQNVAHLRSDWLTAIGVANDQPIVEEVADRSGEWQVVTRVGLALLGLDNPFPIGANRLVELVEGNPILQGMASSLVGRTVPADNPVAEAALQHADIAGNVTKATDELNCRRHGDQRCALTYPEGHRRAQRLVRRIVTTEQIDLNQAIGFGNAVAPQTQARSRQWTQLEWRARNPGYFRISNVGSICEEALDLTRMLVKDLDDQVMSRRIRPNVLKKSAIVG